MQSYIIRPQFIKKHQIENKFYSFLSCEYRKVDIANSNSKRVGELVSFEDVGSQIDVEEYLKFESNHFLGTISCMNGLIYDETRGEKISPKIYKQSPKKLKKGDVIISRNASLGKISFINSNADTILNGGLSLLRFIPQYKWYATAFFIVEYGAEYLTCLTSGGGTQQNAKRQNLLDVPIPFPTTHNHPHPEQVESFVSLIVQNIIDKEEQIKLKNQQIDMLIEQELTNQKSGNFTYRYPRISEIKEEMRFDTGLYEREFQKINFLIDNYHFGRTTVFELGYNISRGQNLQISTIGESYYSDEPKDNFYRLILSKYFTGRTLDKVSYLGNKNKLKTINIGDIIFSCRGEMGRCVIFPEDTSNTITNIDNVHISKEGNIIEKLFIFCFFGYLKKEKILDSIACTGSGAPSFTQYQFGKLKFPSFPEPKQQEIAQLYYNPLAKNNDLSFDSYLSLEQARNRDIGIFQLNMEILALREQLETLVHKIVMEEKIEIDFNY